MVGCKSRTLPRARAYRQTPQSALPQGQGRALQSGPAQSGLSLPSWPQGVLKGGGGGQGPSEFPRGEDTMGRGPGLFLPPPGPVLCVQLAPDTAPRVSTQCLLVATGLRQGPSCPLMSGWGNGPEGWPGQWETASGRAPVPSRPASAQRTGCPWLKTIRQKRRSQCATPQQGRGARLPGQPAQPRGPDPVLLRPLGTQSPRPGLAHQG